MKFRNISYHKQYTDKQIKEWAKDMLDGLKLDLKIYKNQCNKKPDINDISEYNEALYCKGFIEWFINNHFGK